MNLYRCIGSWGRRTPLHKLCAADPVQDPKTGPETQDTTQDLTQAAAAAGPVQDPIPKYKIYIYSRLIVDYFHLIVYNSKCNRKQGRRPYILEINLHLITIKRMEVHNGKGKIH